MSADFESYLEKARHLLGACDEEILRFFRQEGASMVDSVQLMRIIKNISLGEAQKLVHLSETWADQRESHERLNELFWETLESLADPKD